MGFGLQSTIWVVLKPERQTRNMFMNELMENINGYEKHIQAQVVSSRGNVQDIEQIVLELASHDIFFP